MLNKYTPERAISEYVWNGFDAKATKIDILFSVATNGLDTINEIKITDNGVGICYEELSVKFKRFYESHKAINSDSNIDLVKGKNGYGRLTFFKFARFAQWETSYLKGKDIYTYNIKINSETLKDYAPSSPIQINGILKTGTTVTFNEIFPEAVSVAFIDKILKPYLRAEFAWLLELNEEYTITINGEKLDCQSIIAESEPIVHKLTSRDKQEILFECRYIRWNQKMNDEYSHFYFLNTELEFKHKKTTLLNKKGDNFWHSMIVVSDFFNRMIDYDTEEDGNTQQTLFDNTDDKRIFKEIVSILNDFLRKKRRPFLKEQAEVLITKYEEEKVFPAFSDNEWDAHRKQGLKDLIKGMYEVEPAVFTKLNKEQKKVFLELLNLVLDCDERENLFKIIEAVVELDSSDRKEFARILETTRLKQVISTINLITDRLLVLNNLKALLFNHDLNAGEVKHLQPFIEKHYWIFGEEYRLVCAEEVKFEEALEKYIYILRGVKEEVFIEHPDKYKEMDLFLAGTDFRDGQPHNVVVEIKNPTLVKKLKSEHLTQLETYLDVILKQDCFNDKNEYWTFILIGQDYDDIVSRRISNKYTGLIQSGDNYNLFVRKWSEIINEVERRHKYLLEKLQIERHKLAASDTLKGIMDVAAETTIVS